MAENSRDSYTADMWHKNGRRNSLIGIIFLVAWLCEGVQADDLSSGKSLTMEKSKGNCLACHAIADGKLAGNVGPPLIGMKSRFPDADVLRKQIWDATERNPDSRMPPFGRHGILNREEIELIVGYLYTL